MDSLKDERETKINFQNDDTLGIYNPTFKQVKNNMNWLYNKEYHLCSKNLYQYGTLNTRILNKFPLRSNEYKRICEGNITFIFLEDSTVEVNHQIKEVKIKTNLSGLYKYEIDQDSNLKIDFKQHGVMSRKIKYIGKDEIK